jgi:hypothetical protein
LEEKGKSVRSSGDPVDLGGYNLQPGETAEVACTDEHQAVVVESLIVLQGGITETSLGAAVDEARAEESLQACK